ncbi:MAG: DNA-binding MarR family transcriptional regulator [Saprospiraceae bacterium]|jgi:DNA-binding MarR family transcriptional regulator
MGDHKNKRIGFLLERTTRNAKLSFTKAFKNLGVDITPEQWIVIDTVNKNGTMSQKSIGQLSFKNAPTISRIIDNLVKKGLVNRIEEKGDRRKTSISVTTSGADLINHCQNEVDRLRNLSWKGLSDSDYKDFTRILDKIFENFEEYE